MVFDEVHKEVCLSRDQRHDIKFS